MPSRKNIADAFSRLTKIEDFFHSQDDDEYVRIVTSNATPVALKIKEVEQASAQVYELQSIRKCLIDGKRYSVPKQYLPVRSELTFIDHVILRGTRIVVPKSPRKRVVNLAHEGHQGVVKTKERLRTKVWWPGIDRKAERPCAECYGCQLVSLSQRMYPSSMPQQPWEELALDLLGPLPSGDSLLFLLDYYSRWIEVDVIRATTRKIIVSDSTLSLQGMGYLRLCGLIMVPTWCLRRWRII